MKKISPKSKINVETRKVIANANSFKSMYFKIKKIIAETKKYLTTIDVSTIL